MIRCIALPYTPSAEKTAQAIETYANQKEKEGWELITWLRSHLPPEPS